MLRRMLDGGNTGEEQRKAARQTFLGRRSERGLGAPRGGICGSGTGSCAKAFPARSVILRTPAENIFTEWRAKWWRWRWPWCARFCGARRKWIRCCCPDWCAWRWKRWRRARRCACARIHRKWERGKNISRSTTIWRCVPELSGDATLEPNRCQLETELGVTDLSLETQLKEIEQGLFDLLAQRPTPEEPRATTSAATNRDEMTRRIPSRDAR